MKLLILLAAVTLAHAAKLDKTYLPPNAQQSSGASFLQTPLSSIQGQAYDAVPQNSFNQNSYVQNGINAYNYQGRSERPQATYERNAAILRQDNSNDGETYAYAYETENGIYAEESGVATNGVQAQGGFTYTGDDGQVYSIKYTADENGFVPQGDHLPTPPPVPEEILKSLEQNARDEAAGIYDDGSYREAKYADVAQQYYSANAQPINFDDTVVTNSASLRNAGNAPSFRNPENARGLSAGGKLEKTYLPPFAQSQRTTANARQFSFNARDGYRY